MGSYTKLKKPKKDEKYCTFIIVAKSENVGILGNI